MWTKHILRLGTGCGIEIRGDDLRVVALKSRPAGVSVLGRMAIPSFRDRPPHEWGAEYAAFLKGLGLSHLAATVSLPRSEVIVRQIQLPPVSGKELAAAVAYQLDTLHPFGEDEVCYSFAPLRERRDGKSLIPVAIVVAERAKVDSYAELFEAAGIAVHAFTVTAASFHAALRVRWDSPPAPFVLSDRRGRKLEIYGESGSRPALSAEFDLSSMPPARALQLACSELRLGEEETAALVAGGETEPEREEVRAAIGEDAATPRFELRPATELLPAPLASPLDFEIARDGAAMAVALESACPRMGWRTNLLPAERRKSSSRWMYAPTAALAAALALLGLAFVLRPSIQDGNYLAALEAETSRLSQVAQQVNQTQAETGEAKRKGDLLRSFEERTLADLRILSELSTLTPNTAWLTGLELNDEAVQISGEAEAAAPLLGVLNESRWLEGAAFTTSLIKTETGERFQIAAQRRTSPVSQTSPSIVAAGSEPVSADEGVSSTLSTLEDEERPDAGEVR